MDNFFEKVYEIVRRIPPGRVTTYGAIAQYLSTGGAARMVGWAMNASHGRPDVPAHRVVNRMGILTGRRHFDHPELMQQLLENEGVRICNDSVVDFAIRFWDPAKELQ